MYIKRAEVDMNRHPQHKRMTPSAACSCSSARSTVLCSHRNPFFDGRGVVVPCMCVRRKSCLRCSCWPFVHVLIRRAFDTDICISYNFESIRPTPGTPYSADQLRLGLCTALGQRDRKLTWVRRNSALCETASTTPSIIPPPFIFPFE